MELHIHIKIFILYILLSFESLHSLPNNSNANLSTTWINNQHSNNFAYADAKMRAILIRPAPSPSLLVYACGFVANIYDYGYVFSVAILNIHDLPYFDHELDIVWSANRNKPINTNASLELNSDGNMILSNEKSELVWSTDTIGKSVAGMNLTEEGNLVLFSANNSVVWQSFDHPTDTMLSKHSLLPGQKLIASVSETNSSEGLYSYTTKNDEFFLYVGKEVYYHQMRNKPYKNGSLIRLGWDGHLRRFQFDLSNGDIDILEGELSHCSYPLVCGKYGVCLYGQCSSPQSSSSELSWFRPNDIRKPSLGYTRITPLECTASDRHIFVELKQIGYFTFRVDINNTDQNTCKKACLANCFCKAAMFRYGLNSSIGDCYLPVNVYSLMSINEDDSNKYSFSINLKVQKASKKSATKRNLILIIIGLTSGILLVLVIVSALMIWKLGEVEKDDLDNIPTALTRFSYKDLKIATCNFSLKINEEGSRSVFHGSLKDGTNIAVKYLDRIGHIENIFLTEIGSIGNIHHINLIRLIGYCAEKSRRLLVYEYMTNGSLKKWLDDGIQKTPLYWNHRKHIALGIAKGLAYLHEDCRQKIVHLNVTPENILLDENFNAKISGFEMCKHISRDQSHIITILRDTPGYMAPEWLSYAIIEKIDVYNFGVVVLELLCGRKVLDTNQIHLFHPFSSKMNERKLLDMVDEFCEELQFNRKEVIKMMEVAAWCMQNEFLDRPSMSYVVKVLEGIVDVDLSHIDFNFINPINYEVIRLEGQCSDVSLIVPSLLLGPR